MKGSKLAKVGGGILLLAHTYVSTSTFTVNCGSRMLIKVHPLASVWRRLRNPSCACKAHVMLYHRVYSLVGASYYHPLLLVIMTAVSGDS